MIFFFIQENIVCFVSFPTLVNQREQFRFTAEDMVKVKSYTWTNDFLMADHDYFYACLLC